MPGGTLDYRLRIRTADDSADLVTYSTIPADGVYCAIKSAPTGDGQSLQPITGATQISSYDVDVVDHLLVANPVVTTLEDWNYASDAALDAAWPGDGGVQRITNPCGGGLGMMRTDAGGHTNIAAFRTRVFSGFTPGATYTLSLTGTADRSQGGGLTGMNANGVTDYFATAHDCETLSVVTTADGSGNITVELGVWSPSLLYDANEQYGALSVQAGIAGQRIVTMETDDASGQPQLLGLKAFLEFSTDRGTTWLVLLPGYINRLRETDAETMRFTLGQTRRADQTIRIFDTALGLFNQGSCILGGPIPGGWNGIQDYGPTRWKVLDAGTWGAKLTFVQGPFLSGRLPVLMNLQQGSIGSGQLAYTNARAQQYLPSTPSVQATIGSAVVGLSPDAALSARVLDPTTGATLAVLAPRGQYFAAFGTTNMWLVSPTDQSIVLDWTGTGVDQDGTAQPAQPAPGALYDLYVYPTAVSSDAPLHWEGHPVDLAAQLRTLAGFTVDATSQSNTKAAVGAALHLVLRLTSGTTVKSMLDTLHGVFGFAERAKTDGTYEFFATNPSVAPVNGGTISLNSLRSDADDVWANNDATIVNAVSLSLRSFGLWSGDAAQSTPLDLVLAATATVTVTDSDANNYGVQEQSWELEGQITSAVALSAGLIHAIAPTTVANFGLARSQEIFRRVLRGAKEGTVHCLRSQDPGADVGDLLTVNLPHRVAGTVRGGPRQVQIIQRTENAIGPDFRFWDTGSTTTTGAPLPTFTLAADSNDPEHTAIATLTNASAEAAAGAVVRVEYGTGGSAPATGTLLAYLLASPNNLTAVSTPQLAAGTTVWVRMRAEVPGLQPSAWTGWASVTLSGLGAITGLTATPIDGTSEKLTWTNTDTTHPVVVFLSNWGVGANVPVVYLPPGSTSYTLHGLTASTSYTATVRIQESASSFGSSDSVTFTTAGTTPTLSPPTNPSAFAGTPDPNTGVVVIDGTFGIQVRANDADAPVMIVVQVAVETAVGSGTPGAFSDAGSGPGILGGFTRVVLPSAPNDGKLRYLQARETRAGYLDSSESTPVVSVNPWSAVALPPTGTLRPVTVDDETAAIPNSRQLVAGEATAIDTSTPGQIAVDVSVPSQAAGDLLFFNGVAWTRLGIGASGQVVTVVSGAPAWASGGSPARAPFTVTTASLAAGATANGTATLPKTSALVGHLAADRACWVRLYATAAARTADAARLTTDVIPPGAGILADFRFSGAVSIGIGPILLLANDDGTVAATIYYAITNESGATSTVTVTGAMVAMES